MAGETTAKAKAAPKAPTMATRRKRFIKQLREAPNVSKAAKYAGFDTSTAYRHRRQIASFRKDWDAAVNEALDTIEEVLADRIINGVERPHYYGGEVIGTYKTYSDALLMFYLRAKRGDVYGKGALEAPGEVLDSAETVHKQLDIIAARVRARDALVQAT